jgi:hypothetical protein
MKNVSATYSLNAIKKSRKRCKPVKN